MQTRKKKKKRVGPEGCDDMLDDYEFEEPQPIQRLM